MSLYLSCVLVTIAEPLFRSGGGGVVASFKRERVPAVKSFLTFSSCCSSLHFFLSLVKQSIVYSTQSPSNIQTPNAPNQTSDSLNRLRLYMCVVGSAHPPRIGSDHYDGHPDPRSNNHNRNRRYCRKPNEIPSSNSSSSNRWTHAAVCFVAAAICMAIKNFSSRQLRLICAIPFLMTNMFLISVEPNSAKQHCENTMSALCPYANHTAFPVW